MGCVFKGIYLSKALSCMKMFLYKQELLFCQGDGYIWPHCCMNNLYMYISHRSLYAPTYSFWAICSMLISLFRVTSWLDIVNVLWHAGRTLEKNICMNMTYNYSTTIFRRLWCWRFETHWGHCVVSLSKILYPLLNTCSTQEYMSQCRLKLLTGR